MKKETPPINNQQNADESVVLWVLVLIFLALTTLTVNSYSDAGQQQQADPLTTTVKAAMPEQNSANIQLINANSTSQTDAKTLKM